MTYMLVVILHDLSHLPALLEAWKRIGVPGVTIMHSVGGYQAETWLAKIGLGGIGRLLDHEDTQQRMLISVISDETLLEQAIAEADQVVEGFDRPHSGILFALPVSHTLGIRKRGHAVAPREDGAKPGAVNQSIDANTPVSQIINLLDLSPVQVQADAPLRNVIQALLTQPRVQVACVVNLEERLIGLIDITSLANAFFFEVFPEKFISDVTDIDKVMAYLEHSKVNTAEDLMQPPQWVKMHDPVEKVFQVLHEAKLSGIPVVDDHYHVLGFVNLLELMAFCSQDEAHTEDKE